MNKAIIILAIVIFSNTSYNIDRANVYYKFRVSATGYPLSLSYDISSHIYVSQAGVAVVDVNMGDIPVEWTDVIDENEIGVFILSKANIATMTVNIDGETIALLDIGKENDIASSYYGANIVFGSVSRTDTLVLKWNVATGILLNLHAEWMINVTNIVLDVDYISSDVNIYSDQSVFEQFENNFIKFITSTTGIIIIVVAVIAAIIIVMAIYHAKKNKNSTIKQKEMMRRVKMSSLDRM